MQCWGALRAWRVCQCVPPCRGMEMPDFSGIATATGLSDGTDNGGDSDVEDTNAVVCTDPFVKLRPLITTANGSRPRTFVTVAKWAARLGGLGMLASIPHALHIGRWYVNGGGRCDGCAYAEVYDTEGGVRGQAILGFIQWPVGNCISFWMASFLPDEFIRAVRLESGPLARLGLGTKKIAEREQKKLQRWPVLLSVVALGLMLFSVAFFSYGPYQLFVQWGTPAATNWGQSFDQDGSEFDGIPKFGFLWWCYATFCIGWGSTYLVVYPLCMAWWLAMKLAARLAIDDVIEVAKDVKAEALQSDSLWTDQIAKPCIKLAQTTMPDLSSGFGRGTAILFLLLLSFSFGRFCRILDMFTDNEDNGLQWVWQGFAPLAIGLIVPFVVAVDVAAVSSMADLLTNKINCLRLSWESTEEAQAVHARVYPLQHTLSQLNQGQGLGFVCLGNVLDKVRVWTLASLASHVAIPTCACVLYR